MAKIPTFEQLGEPPAPRTGGGVVQIRGKSGAEAAPAEALAQAGHQLVAESTPLWHMVKQEEEKANTTRVEDAWNQYKTNALDLMLGEKGVLKLEGGNAVNGNIVQTVSRGLDAKRREIESSLVNEEQRARFRQRANVTDLQASERTLGHLASQQRVYDKQTMDGVLAAETASVTAQPNDEVAFRGSVLRVQGNADRYLRSQGVTDEGAIKAYQDNLSDTLWAARIKKLMYPNPENAENMLRATENQIHSPVVRDQLRAEIKNGAMPFRAGQSAEKILSEVRAIPTRTKLEAGTRAQELAKIEAALAKNPGNADLVEARYALAEVDPNDAARGIPNAKIVAAQLPIAMARVDKEATRLYGPDVNNADRATFVKALESELRQKNAHDVQALNAIQNSTLDELGAVVRKPETVGTRGAQMPTLADYMKDETFSRKFALLDHRGQMAIANEVRVMANQDARGDPVLLNELRNRLYLPADDPKRVNTWTQIMTDPRIQGSQLTPTQLNYLHADFQRAQTEDGRSYANVRRGSELLVRAAMQGDQILTMAGTDRSRADLAQYLWAQNADKIVSEYNKAGRDIRPLFDPASKESLVSQAEIQRWKAAAGGAGSAQALSTMAAQAQATSPPVPVPADVKTPEQAQAFIDKLPPNATHVIWNGQTMDIRPLRKKPQAIRPAAGSPIPTSELVR